jgi:hypothetical protein
MQVRSFLNQLNWLYICIRLYLQYILNSIFTVVFYMMRWTKQDLTCIYFKEILNQLNLLCICICLYVQQTRVMDTWANVPHLGCNHSLGLKEFLDQLNLLYICICLYFTTDQELWACKLMDRIMDCDHSLGRKEVLKFIYCFMILFLTV